MTANPPLIDSLSKKHVRLAPRFQRGDSYRLDEPRPRGAVFPICKRVFKAPRAVIVNRDPIIGEFS
jgi:hypothetical protein